ncbi:16598_t:CDS:2, partial [Acaulospora colombiana]
MAFVYMGNQLTVSVAFTAIQIFSMIKSPMNIISAFIALLLGTQVALDRINSYLDEEEVPTFVSSLLKEEEARENNPDRSTVPTTAPTELDTRLGIRNGHFRWNQPAEGPEEKPKKGGSRWKFWQWRMKSKNNDKLPTHKAPGNTNGTQNGQEGNTTQPSILAEAQRFELMDINVIFPTGKLTVVTGPTASGKSALLLALLGEMTAVEDGSVKPEIFLPKNPTQLEEESGLRNSIAYCSQSPWLEHLTIQDNILFGSPMDQERYNQVLECCALKPDLKILEDGDLTEIGARGVSLSGGQKARVALARAAYSRSKHVLLDDPLSAV